MTAARDLTNAEALSILEPVIGPKTGARITVPANLGSVTYEYCDSTGCRPIPLANLDPRFAVFLLRLGEFLNGAYGIIKIRHFGAYPGGSGQPSHNAGIAIDIGSFVDKGGTVYSVYNDWGSKPKSGPGYRLKPGDKGYNIFKDVYEFTSNEGDDLYGGAHSQIGVQDSYISHPDLNDSTRAQKHKDHFHLQAGQQIKGPVPTGGGGDGGGGGSLPKPPESAKEASSGGLVAFVLIAGVIGGAAFFHQKKTSTPRSSPSPKLPEGSTS